MLNPRNSSREMAPPPWQTPDPTPPIAPEIERVAAGVRERLRASGDARWRTLSCDEHEGILVLRGRVSSYYHKQLAQESLRQISGTDAIVVDVASDAP
jgi:hypothetical protein